MAVLSWLKLSVQGIERSTNMLGEPSDPGWEGKGQVEGKQPTSEEKVGPR